MMMTIKAFLRRHPVLTYYVLTFAISWGGLQLIVGPASVPGEGQLLFMFLAIAAGPTVASLLLTGLLEGKAGYRDLLARLTRWQVGPRWYGVALLLNPLLLLFVLVVLSLFSSAFVPGLFTTSNLVHHVGFALLGGLAAGLFEELGWTGFATPRLLKRQSILAASLLLGVLWSTWHVAGDVPDTAAEWGTLWGWRVLLWMFAGMMPYRILMTWVYRHTGSVLGPVCKSGIL